MYKQLHDISLLCNRVFKIPVVYLKDPVCNYMYSLMYQHRLTVELSDHTFLDIA